MNNINDSVIFDPWMKDQIDAAVSALMHQTYQHKTYGAALKCAEYAILGARLLTTLSKRPYFAVAGSQIVGFGNDQFELISPSRRERRNAKKLADIQSYHCWIECQQHEDGSTHLEYIDFTSRYDRQIAQLLKVPDANIAEENYLWDRADTLDYPIPQRFLQHPSVIGRSHGWRWKDPVCTRLLRAYEKNNEAYFRQQSAELLQLLTRQIETLMQSQQQHCLN
ncbi:hypothetical protein H8K47_17365 [Undibacterium sp. CY7W]|uniref:Uncharacterized protein n=1 Tax=Undibacterium rugosum TaxID=2762291 RepID=A0A923KUI4_9BURK|nr:hypothetical protein [Undibacterium rugosum]MBC3937129.1 hypothetical protein [Undibacterium rugosum]